VEGRDDREIMTHVDDAAGEGDALCMVLGSAGEDIGGEILELDGLGDSSGFVEAIHVGIVVRGDRSKRGAVGRII